MATTEEIERAVTAALVKQGERRRADVGAGITLLTLALLILGTVAFFAYQNHKEQQRREETRQLVRTVEAETARLNARSRLP